MGNTKRSAAEVIGAIDGSAGIKTTIAGRLGVDRHTVDSYLDRWGTVRQAYDDEVARVGDMAESKLYEAMRAGDRASIRWYLARVRGGKYTERQEITGEDGGPLEIITRRVAGRDGD